MKFQKLSTPDLPKRHSRWLAVVVMLSVGCLSACGSASAEETAAASPAVVPVDGAAAVPVDETAPTTIAPEASDSVAEQPSSSDPQPAGAEPTLEQAQQAYRDFTECMQNEGINMPPAVFDAQGRIDLDAQITDSERLDPNAAIDDVAADFAAAELQCIPDNGEALLALITPDASSIRQAEAQITGELDAQLADLAVCMRKEFPDFPDPLPLNLDLTSDSGQDFDPFPGISAQDPLYADAFLACGREVGLDIPSA